MDKKKNLFQTKSNTLTFSGENCNWNISSPDFSDFRINGIRTKLYADGHWLTLFTKNSEFKKEGGKVIIKEEIEGLIASLSISLSGGFFVWQLELKNNSSKDIVLDALHLLEIGENGSFSLGKKEDPLNVFTDSGGGWWAGVTDIESSSPFKEQWELLPEEDKILVLKLRGKKPKAGFHNSSGGISLLYNSRAKLSLVVGFLTFNRTSNNITLLYEKEKGITSFWAGCNFAGFRLKPGKNISSEKLFFGIYPSPFAGLEEYAIIAGKLNTPKLPAKPPLGWCSWYAYRLKMTESNVLANARAISKRFPGYNFSYIQADHGWQYKDICGLWTETNEKFPNGIKWLAKKLKNMGFKLGLWLAPFTVSEYSPIFNEHPEYLIKDKKGNPKIMVKKWVWSPHGRCYCLDPTNPGAQKFLKETFTFLRKLGVRYWKLDFIWDIADNDKNTVYFNKNYVKGAEVYRKGLSTIENIIGDDYIYWCSNPVNLGFGIGTTSMTACDIGNTGFSLAKKTEGRTEDLKFFRQNATTIISRYFLHKRLFFLNPDVVEVGPPGDYEEAKIRLSLVALSGGQTFFGDDLTRLSEKQWNLLAKTIPVYGEAARPVDLFENTYPSSYPKIWHLPIKTSWGKWEIAGLFNLTQKPDEITINFPSLGIEEDKEYLIFEFWAKKFLGKKKNFIKIGLKPVTTKLLLIKEVPTHPQVLSTDMHITQGKVELSGVTWNAKSKVLKGIARRQKGENGNLFIFLPEGYLIKKSSAKIKKKGDFIILPLIFKGPTVKWFLKF